MSIPQIQNKINRLRKTIEDEVGGSLMDLIEELIELEILLEKKCNQ